jgi:Type IV pili methyl-accepting chemotaxis transducer N-term
MADRKTLITRRSIVQAATLGLFLPTAQSANAEIALAAALNRVARFRALSQRSVKAYAQMALNVLPDRSKTTLDTAQRLIQAGFTELATREFSADITQQIAVIRAESAKLTALLAAPPRRETLQAASEQADRLTEQANKTTELVTSFTKSGSARIIDVSGKQRMLSQRLAKNYFLAAASAAPARAAAIRQQMSADRAEFKTALATMQNTPISTPAIRNDIDLCANQWFLFETSIDKPTDRPVVMEDVAIASERLLDIANSLTDQYEKALNQIIGK